MNKRELIEVITSVNRSATREFLAEFSERDLWDYVRQLESLGLCADDRVEGKRIAGGEPIAKACRT